MAGSVKGIIVEIGGDTSALQKALSKVNSATSSLSRELRGVNSLLKLDPKNTELLKQKQDILNKSVEATQSKLEELRKVKEEADRKMAEGTAINEENYRALQREIANTENKLKQLQLETSNWTKAGTKIDQFGQKIDDVGNKLGKMGMTLTKTVTPAVAGMATLAIKTFDEVDEGADIVIKKTGATADAAEELEAVYEKVAGNVAGSFEDVGNAVGEINTRFGFTNKELEEASEKFLKFAKINDTDVNTAVQKVSRYMGDASIESSKYGEVLDDLTSVAQASGISIDSLAEMLTKYGAPMRALGLSTKESIAIFSGWEKAGVNTEIAFSGMKKAISNWGKAGKDSSKEFKKTMEEIKKCPDIAKATTKAIEVFGAKAGPDLADAIKGGRFEYSEFLNILQNSNGILEETYTNIMDETDEAQVSTKKLKVEFSKIGKEILQTAYPAVEDILGGIRDLIKQFNSLDPQLKKNIIKFTAFGAALGPIIKTGGTLISGVGKGISSAGKLCKTVAEVKSGMTVANNATGLLAKGLAALTTPTGLLTTGIVLTTAAITAMAIASANAEKETKEAFSNIGQGASDFISGIQNAKSHLDSFNSTLFASSEEQQKLQEDMDNVQKGITEICKTASDERRGYTQEEITQLDEYFNKLRELKNRELEIQKSISSSITQQAEQSSQTFQGTLEEYKVNSQEWIKTAQEQKDKEISIINERTTQEIALLQQRYGEKATLDNEEYAREYNSIQENKEKAIQEANDQVAQVNLAFSNGYLERAKQDDGFYAKYQEYNKKIEEENQRNTDTLNNIQDNVLLTQANKNATKEQENYRHQNETKKIWDEMYKDMSDEQEKELGIWLANVAQTEMYGGKLDDETKKIVDGIVDSYDSMPKKTRETMKNAMSPMLEEMQNKEPSLFAKATGIAEGILSRLKKSFDIHSPSRKMREIFNYVMEGGELGIEDEKETLYKQMEEVAKGVQKQFKGINLEMQTGKIHSSIIEQNKTVFTTPQIVFNVQELDEAKLQQCFNYVNKKFGSAY